MSAKSKDEVLNIVTTTLATSINISWVYLRSLSNFKDIIFPYIQYYDYLDLRKNWVQVWFRNYFKENISQLIDLVNNWYISNWEVWYVPKRTTLLYRLYILDEEVKFNEKKLEALWFDFEDYYTEIKNLFKFEFYKNSVQWWLKEIVNIYYRNFSQELNVFMDFLLK